MPQDRWLGFAAKMIVFSEAVSEFACVEWIRTGDIGASLCSAFLGCWITDLCCLAGFIWGAFWRGDRDINTFGILACLTILACNIVASGVGFTVSSLAMKSSWALNKIAWTKPVVEWLNFIIACLTDIGVISPSSVFLSAIIRMI